MHNPQTETRTNYSAELDKAISEPKHVRQSPEWENAYIDLWLDFIGNDPKGLASYLKELDAEESASSK
jgi:hypothetical protein